VRQFARDLRDVVSDGGSDDMFQIASSVQFSESCATYYATPLTVRWDLDFDGSKETTSNTVTVSAEALDGPSNRALEIETRHPIDGLTAARTIAVEIRNLSPVLGSWAFFDAAGRRIGVDVPFALQNRAVSGVATFTDQGRLDHQTAVVDWADGATSTTFTEFIDAFGGVTGHVTAQHAYGGPGSFNVRVVVTDDDGGSGTAVATLRVVSPADAVRQAIALLDSLIATSTDPARMQLIAARAALAGSGNSGDESGALTKIEEGQAAAAIARLATALRQLDNAATMLNVSIVRAIVAEVATALGA
jgi:hypothetical protein